MSRHPRETSHRPLDVYGFHKLDIYKGAKTYKKHSFWNHYHHFLLIERGEWEYLGGLTWTAGIAVLA